MPPKAAQAPAFDVQTPGDFATDPDADVLDAEVTTVPSAPITVGGERRIIGEDWSSKTASEAHAAGVDKTVMCSDGYYVPGR